MSEREKRKCLECNTEFKVLHDAAKYCSPKCRVRAYRKRDSSERKTRRASLAALERRVDELGHKLINRLRL
jgi:hypothetical protein